MLDSLSQATVLELYAIREKSMKSSPTACQETKSEAEQAVL